MTNRSFSFVFTFIYYLPAAIIIIIVFFAYQFGHAQEHFNIELKESWYEKLLNWEEALNVYERKQNNNSSDKDKVAEYALGQIRCLHALGEWEKLHQLTNTAWELADDKMRSFVAPYPMAIRLVTFGYEI